ncbi:hypothetical protein ITJ50_00990 [Curtobacterium sp. VKM Ac-2889]|uniref:hypothetical protein n=1 Tax=unclassified Curtobacterium TaxID=257496 RepID=UPI00188BB3CF|nr:MULTISPECIES: hypothetical protein [unclassified Curtobacterium]MBF4597162.1 hypothetical protein [Curtobacterium sp. VKM Ac-1796]MBF4609794.1 hypothetical protein [Curtobacterium sp. VKM Ac-2889]
MAGTIGQISDALIDLHHIDDPEADLATKDRVFQAVLTRLNELEVFEGTVNDETGDHQLDPTQLLVAVMGMQHYLIDRLASARQVDPEAIRFELREFTSGLDDD